MASGAKVEEGAWVVHQDGIGTLEAGERAVLRCGCAVFVGETFPSGQEAWAPVPCRPAHMVIMERFEALRANVAVDPGNEPVMVTVYAQLLTIAEGM